MAALATVTRARPLKNTPRRPSRSSNTPASGRVIRVAMVELAISQPAAFKALVDQAQGALKAA